MNIKEIMELVSNMFTTIGVIASFLFSINTLKNAKKNQLDQEGQIEENRFEEKRGILQIYTSTEELTSSNSFQYLIIKNIGKSPLMVKKLLPDDNFLKFERGIWELSIFSKNDFWIAPNQSFNLVFWNKHTEEEIDNFDIVYEYETLNRVFSGKVEKLSYQLINNLTLSPDIDDENKCLEEIHYQLAILNRKINV